MFHRTTQNLAYSTVFEEQYCFQPTMQHFPHNAAFTQPQHCIPQPMQYLPYDTVFQQTQTQDQRIAALQEQIAKCELDKHNIMKALKAERVCRRNAEADMKAAKRQVIRLATRGLAGEGQHRQNGLTPGERDQLQQIAELTSDNAALKKEIGDKELRWSEEKEKIMEALEAERAAWRNAEAVLRKQIADNAIKEAEKESILEALWKEKDTRQIEREATEVLIESLQSENKSLQLSAKAREEAIDLTKINNEIKTLLNEANQELSDLVAKTTREKAVLEAELRDSEHKVVQCEARCRSEVARCFAESDDKIKDIKVTNRLLQEQIIELWHINKNLEECAQRTDKEKARLKKNAEKVAKEAAEKERKEEKENKKKAKELLKTQKKEREA